MRLLVGFIVACVLLAVLAVGGIVASYRQARDGSPAVEPRLVVKTDQSEKPAGFSASQPGAASARIELTSTVPVVAPVSASQPVIADEDADDEPVATRNTEPATSAPVHWAQDRTQVAARERLRAAREALLSDPYNITALDDGIAAGKWLGRWLVVSQLVERKCELSPEAVAPRFELASALMRLSRWIEAIQPLMFVVEHQPDSVEAWHNLALCNQALGQLEEALRAWDRVVVLAPADLDARRQRAEVLLDFEQWRRAADDLQVVVRDATPTRADRLNLSLALIKLARLAEAREVLEAGLRRDPDWVPGINRLASVLLAQADERPGEGAELRAAVRELCDRSLGLVPAQPEVLQIRELALVRP